MRLKIIFRRLVYSLPATLLVISSTFSTAQNTAAATTSYKQICDLNSPLCTEVFDSINQYTGHDEPSVLYYSSTPGSGNSNIYQLTLPKEPLALPNQSGTGGTDSFQLHPAFWFGMAMCDTQSGPNPGAACTPDSDTNIYNSPNPAAASYIGNHPGAAYMEMQFYPPGWMLWPFGVSCSATQWCAALNIDSFSENMNTGVANNQACLDTVGIEPVNFAFITKSGVAQAPANPVNSTLATYTPDPTKDLFMNTGDKLVVSMHDTSAGFQVVIQDKTTGQAGSMTASIANQFGQVKYDPTATSCTSIPYAFHPMYSTSSEATRVPWAAHSYNVAFSDEIGHFEYCNGIGPNYNCNSAGANDPAGLDRDDYYCIGQNDSTNIRVAGCLATDLDFDGVPYQKTWPGTFSSPATDALYHTTPILFTSPLFVPSGSSSLSQYARVAFETDLPRIELTTNPACNRSTGANCVNPPVGAKFYPFYSTRGTASACQWQLGGAYIPGTTNLFGGSSSTEFGPLLQLFYPATGGVVYRYNDFRQVLSTNPCLASAP